jgi:hypothetical protein
MDKYGFISNSHGILDIRRYPKMLLIMEVISFIHGYGIQTIIQMQMKRREEGFKTNSINACRIIKDNFNNSSVGLFADDFFQKNGA